MELYEQSVLSPLVEPTPLARGAMQTPNAMIDDPQTPFGMQSMGIPMQQMGMQQIGVNPQMQMQPYGMIVPGNDVIFLTGTPTHLTHITLQAGINIYHGSLTKNSFDPNDIKLSDGTLLAMFSNNPKLAADNFMNCAMYPNHNGYLHQFKTKKDIPYIELVSAASMNKPASLTYLDRSFCQRAENPKLNGFAYAIRHISDVGNQLTYDYIIGLCNPNEYLEYVSTSSCVNPYRLSEPSNNFY